MGFPTKPCFLAVLIQLLIPGQSLQHLGQPSEESYSETLPGEEAMNGTKEQRRFQSYG